MTILVSIQQPVHQWQIPPEAVASLRARFPHIEFTYATTPDERARGLAVCDAAYTWILRPEELSDAPALRWLHTSAVAVETLCLPELFARGVRVTNTRGVQAVPIAEHVLAVVLAFAKQLPFVLENQRQAHWAQNAFTGDRLPWLLRGRTLGLVGVGTIGSAIAARARAFGMRVVAMRRQPGAPAGLDIDAVYGPGQLPDLLAQSQVLVVAAPLTPETEGLIGAARVRPAAGRGRLRQRRPRAYRPHRRARGVAPVGPPGRRLARRVPARAAAAHTPAVDLPQRHPHPAHVGLSPGALGRGGRSLCREHPAVGAE